MDLNDELVGMKLIVRVLEAALHNLKDMVDEADQDTDLGARIANRFHCLKRSFRNQDHGVHSRRHSKMMEMRDLFFRDLVHDFFTTN